MSRLTHRGVVHVEAAVDPPHDHVPGVEADPDVQRNPMRALNLLAITATVSCIRSAA